MEKKYIFCETKKSAIKEITLGGKIIDGSVKINVGIEGGVECRYLKIEPSLPQMIRYAYKTEAEALAILSAYFRKVADDCDQYCITWFFAMKEGK